MRWMSALVMCAALAATPAEAQTEHSYWYLGLSANYDKAIYIDASSVSQLAPDTRRAWVWTFNSRMQNIYHVVTYDVQLEEVRCATQQMRAVSLVEYRMGDRALISSNDVSTDWTHVAPQTFGEIEMDFICGTTTERSQLGTELAWNDQPDVNVRSLTAWAGNRRFDLPAPVPTKPTYAAWNSSPK